MRKFKNSGITIALAVLGLFFASCSFGPQAKIQKIRGAYGSIMLEYNSYGPNYQKTIPLQDLVTDFVKPDRNNTISVSFDYYALAEFPDIKVRLVSTDEYADSWWRELSSESKINGSTGLEFADTGTFSDTFIITNPSTNTDLSKYFLVISADLRAGETTTNHESQLEFYANPLVTQQKLYSIMADGKIVIEYDDSENDYGFKITLNGTDDTYWTDKRYHTIDVANGLKISISGDNQRPNGEGDKKVIYYPFVDGNTSYTFSFDSENSTIWTPRTGTYYGEAYLDGIENIQLNKPCEPYPIAKLDNINASVLNSPLYSVNNASDFNTSYEIVFWGSYGYDAWLSNKVVTSFTDYEDVAFNLTKLNGSENTSNLATINTSRTWWYNFTYSITSNNVDLGDCSWIYSRESSRCNLASTDTLTAEDTYFLTHAANTYPDVYTLSSTTGDNYSVSGSESYTIEWVDGGNYNNSNFWGNFAVPANWKTIWDLDTNDGDDVCNVETTDNGTLNNDNDINTNYTPNADSSIKVYSDKGLGYYHIYKN